ncbi:class I SAM-dependent methyltransferase [Thiolapillus sp.]
MRLTDKVHLIVSEYLQPGDLAVDATAGNGHDSLFLAEQVGKQGKVFAFDIQEQALNRTATHLREAGQEQQLYLIHRGHEHLRESLPRESIGQIKAILFNLGYLPHSDKTTITRQEHTLPALKQAREVLASDGIISVLAYRGHPGGQEEALAVRQCMTELAGDDLQLSILESPGPVLLLLAQHKHV